MANDLRLPAAVIAGTAVAWLVLGWIGGQRGWTTSTLVLIDLAALAAFAWALIVTYWTWRRLRGSARKD